MLRLTPTHTPRRLLALLAAACVAGTPLHASDGPAVFEELVRLLDAPDLATRVDATHQLMNDQALSLATLETRLSRGDLTGEQFQRLLQVTHERFIQTKRAAMGVQFMQTGPLTERTVIDDTIPGFPSRQLLQPGDIIIEVAGIPLDGMRGRYTLRYTIISREPGDILPIVIRRGAQKIPLTVQLGAFEDLRNHNNNTGELTDIERAMAWRMRCDSLLRKSMAPAIETGVDAASWTAAEGEFMRRRTNTFRQRAQAGPRSLLVAGGDARTGPADLDEMNQRVGVRGKQDNFFELQQWQQMQARNPLENWPVKRQTLEQELDAVEKRLAELKRQEATGEAAPPVARNIRTAVESAPLAEQIRITTNMRDALKAEAAERSQQP